MKKIALLLVIACLGPVALVADYPAFSDAAPYTPGYAITAPPQSGSNHEMTEEKKKEEEAKKQEEERKKEEAKKKAAENKNPASAKSPNKVPLRPSPSKEDTRTSPQHREAPAGRVIPDAGYRQEKKPQPELERKPAAVMPPAITPPAESKERFLPPARRQEPTKDGPVMDYRRPEYLRPNEGTAPKPGSDNSQPVAPRPDVTPPQPSPGDRLPILPPRIDSRPGGRINPAPENAVCRLGISSSPGGAEVQLDSNYAGRTPQSGYLYISCTPGRHLITVSRQGYQPWSRSMLLYTGSAPLVSAVLARIPVAGSLDVFTDPARASIYVDGRYTGSTGADGRLHLSAIAGGRHTITARASGYIEESRTINQTDGGNQRIYFRLRRAYVDSGDIVLYSSPGRASIYIDGNYRGMTSWGGYIYLSHLSAGYHRISAYLNGYESWERWVSVTPGRVNSFNINLIRYEFNFPSSYNRSILDIGCNVGYATLYVDGKYAGLTDMDGNLQIYDLYPGSRDLVIKKTGYNDWQGSVYVNSGERKRLDVYMHPADTFGSLLLECRVPNTDVYLDDRYLGTIGFDGLVSFERVDPGLHKLTLSRSGYASYSQTVEILSGGSLRLFIDMQRSAEEGNVLIESEPAGADVLLDGELRGRTPLLLEGLGAGEHELTVRLEGFLDWRSAIAINGGDAGTVKAVLLSRQSLLPSQPAAGEDAAQSDDGMALPGMSGPDPIRASATPNEPFIMVDNVPLMLDVSPVIRQGRVFVPLRGVFEALRTEVTWIPQGKVISCRKGETQIILSVGSRTAYINGRAFRTDVPPVLRGGRVLIPLRFVAQALGSHIRWDNHAKRVMIYSMQSDK